MSDTALILAGHGSHISPNTAGVVWNYVDRLRELGAAGEVTAGFWKEPPALHQVLDTVEATNVFVVPVFTAQGYFTQSVIPAEMGLHRPVTKHVGKTITLTRTLGEHPAMSKVVQKIVLQQINEHSLDRADTVVAIIGHGTRRNSNSRNSTRNQANCLRELNWVSGVVDVYLDDEPDIPSIYDTTNARNIIALPYFLARGSHVSIDVPRALGLSGLTIPQTVAGRQIYYSESLSADESIVSAVHALALDAGLPKRGEPSTRSWRGFPKVGRRTLDHALTKGVPLRFGQVMVSERRVWHRDNEEQSTRLSSAADLRAWLREDPFRPLATSADLPAGWHVDLDQPAHAHAVLETVYPGLIADWAAERQGRFVAEPLPSTSERQVGMFKGIHHLATDLIEGTIAKVCGSCVRQPTWWKDKSRSDLPCKAACNYWLSIAAKVGESVI